MRILDTSTFEYIEGLSSLTPKINFTGIYENIHGIIYFYLKGELHRDDGPAVIYQIGKSWYLNGIKYRTKEIWFENLQPDQKVKALFNLEIW